jgi:hypothetical protein
MVYVRVINQSTHDITKVQYQKVATPIDGAWLEFIGHPIQIPRSGGQKLFALRPASYTFLISGHNWNPTPLMALVNGKEYVIIVRDNDADPKIVGPDGLSLPLNTNLTLLVKKPSSYTLPDYTAINETDYLGSVSWQAGISPQFENDATFRGGMVYQAVVTLTPKPGYTLDGIPANFFSYSGAIATNSPNSGVVTITFLPTDFTTQWYVFAGGNDANTGLSDTAPLATVDRALVRMRNEYSLATWPRKGHATDEQKVSINIKGTLSYITGPSNGMVSITGTNAYPEIYLQGYGAGTNEGFLDAAGRSRVLYISENNRVTLLNQLTLKRGSNDKGGGAYIGGGGLLTLNGGTITGNAATGNYGGGVYLAAGSIFIMKNGTISSNTAKTDGGGVWVADGANFTLEGGTIELNNATDGYGGGISTGGVFMMNGGTISQNHPAISGGGIRVNGGSATMTKGIIELNTAIRGAGVYVMDGTFTLKSEGIIRKNSASQSGGGVGVLSSFIMENGTIVLNTAQWYGGGVYVETGSTPSLHTVFTKTTNGVINGTGLSDPNSANYNGNSVYINAPSASFTKYKNNSVTTVTIQFDTNNYPVYSGTLIWD